MAFWGGRSVVAALCALVAILSVSPAQAQTQAPVEEEVVDPGIKLGRLRLRPRLSLSYAFDSNIFLRDDPASETGPGPTPGHRLHIAPGLSLSSAPDSPVMLSFGGGADYRQYLSNSSSIKGLSDFAATADLDVTLNPRGDVTFSFLNNFRRTTAAPTVELPTPFNRDYNRLGVKVGISPGGKALTFDLYYYFNVDHFENFGFGSASARSLDNMAHDIILRGRWKFLPKTAVTLDVMGTIWRWDAAAFANPNLFRAYLGIIGNFTTKLSGTARLGYGNSFHSSGESFNSVVGDLDVAYAFLPSLGAHLTYARDFGPSAWGNYFASHQVGLALNTLLWRRLMGNIGATYMRLGFSGNPNPTILGGAGATLLVPSAVRADNVLGLSAGLNLRTVNWLSFQLNYAFNARNSNNGLYFSAAAGTLTERFGFAQHTVNIGTTISY